MGSVLMGLDIGYSVFSFSALRVPTSAFRVRDVSRPGGAGPGCRVDYMTRTSSIMKNILSASSAVACRYPWKIDRACTHFQNRQKQVFSHHRPARHPITIKTRAVARIMIQAVRNPRRNSRCIPFIFVTILPTIRSILQIRLWQRRRPESQDRIGVRLPMPWSV